MISKVHNKHQSCISQNIQDMAERSVSWMFQAMEKRIQELEVRVATLEDGPETSYGAPLRTGDVVMYWPEGKRSASCFYVQPNGNTCYLWDKPAHIGILDKIIYEPRRSSVRRATREESRTARSRLKEWRSRPRTMHPIPEYPTMGTPVKY